jgi:hypothetical protein
MRFKKVALVTAGLISYDEGDEAAYRWKAKSQQR